MKSVTTKKFRNAFSQLPERIQKNARASYKLWKIKSNHTSLRFKKIHANREIFSVRVSLGYRALGVMEDDTMIWFWIGTHSEYDKIISRR